MKKLVTVASLASSFVWFGCASSPPAPAADSKPSERTSDGPVAPAEPRRGLGEDRLPEAARVPSPVSGPALDEYPAAPPRAVASEPLDLRSLTEPPQLVVEALGHTSKVKSLDYTHDGRFVVSSSYDKTVRVWSAESGELVRTIRGDQGAGPAGRIYASALSGRDELLAVGGWLGKSASPRGTASDEAFQIRVLDFYSGTTLRLLAGHTDVVLDLDFSRAGTRLVSGGGDGRALVWDARSGALERTLAGHSGSVHAVAWSPDDRFVVTGGSDQSVRLWDATSGSLVRTWDGHTGPVTSVAFTPDGRHVVSSGADGTIRLTDATRGTALGTIARLPGKIGSFSIAPDGKRLVATTTEAPFESVVLSIPDGRITARFAGHDNVVLASAISPNGKWAATIGGSDYGLAVWSVSNAEPQVLARGHGSAVWSVGFGADGSSFAWGHRYEPPAGAPYQINGPLEARFALASSHLELAVPPSGSLEAGSYRARETARGYEAKTPSGREDATLEIWERGSRRAVITRDQTSGYAHLSFTLSETADLVVSGGENGALASYDTRTGSKLRDFAGHTGDVLAVALSRDGRRLVSGSADQTVRLWDVPSGQLLLTLFHARNHEWIAFTGAGYFAASAYGDRYLGWHVNRGANHTAGFFAATGLEGQLRHDSVVYHYVTSLGDVREAVRLSNALLPSGAAAIPFYRFEDLPQFAPPEIYHLNPGLDLEMKSDRIEVTAEASSPSSEPITEIEFLVNGRPLDAKWLAHVGKPIVTLDGRHAKIRGTLPLPEERNRIAVVARNRLVSGAPAYFDVRRKGGPGELERLYRPDLFVLAVGVSRYASPAFPSGEFAHVDARAVADAFAKQNETLYGEVKKRVLENTGASRSEILGALEWLRASDTDDVAVVYLAGHATRDERGDYYFLPHDGDRSRLAETALRWSDFEAALAGLPARVLVLADTCHAGSVLPSGPRPLDPTDLSEALRADVNPLRGTVVMTAASGREMSFESPQLGHGVFTSALLEGLRGNADYDGDHRVHVRELQYFVTSRVPELTGGKQHPTTDVPRSVPNFALSDRPRTASSSKKAPR